MSVINILSPHVADLIAAGEVVERPASVIKELMENSFDAGARSVTCEIRNGGMTYIRMTDDGCGMSPEDAGIAFLRHATSKLSSEEGLEAISTMGFRGEALAAISSVSHMELLTRQKGAPEGTRVTLSAGDIDDMTAFGCPEGTTMICRDLFYNTPARLKFMKSDRSEASSCITAALRCALGRPEVSVRMLRDGTEEFFSPGDGKIDSCVYSLLCREEASSMLRCTSSSPLFSVDGFIASPAEGRGNRAHQFFFVNGRFIKSQLLQSALEQAYKNTLLVGRYPSCVLYLRLGLGSVDVNVHPAKTEVRFGSEKAVFDFVYQAVRYALSAEDRLAGTSGKASVRPAPGASVSSAPSASASSVTSSSSASPASAAHSPIYAATAAVPASSTAVPSSRVSSVSGSASSDIPSKKDDFYQTMTAEAFRARSVEPASRSASAGLPAVSSAGLHISAAGSPAASALSSSSASSSVLSSAPSAASAETPSAFHSPVAAYGSQMRLDLADTDTASTSSAASETPSASHDSTLSVPPSSASGARSIPFPAESGASVVENSVQNVEKSSLPNYKILGEAFRTYIIVEQNDEIILIDKHAAHERMIFDRLKASGRSINAQMLLAPSIIRVSLEDAELLEANADLLSRLGFEMEPYGEKEYIVRGVPADMNVSDVPASVEEVLEKLRSNRTPDPDAVWDEILHTVACKAAIKAGWDTHRAELDRLVVAVLTGAIKYCPHGRPVSALLTHKDLDRMFRRIV